MVTHTKEALRAEAILTQLLQEVLRAEVVAPIQLHQEVLQAAVPILHQAEVLVQVVLHLSVHLPQVPVAVHHQDHLVVAAAAAADVAVVAVDVVN